MPKYPLYGKNALNFAHLVNLTQQIQNIALIFENLL